MFLLTNEYIDNYCHKRSKFVKSNQVASHLLDKSAEVIYSKEDGTKQEKMILNDTVGDKNSIWDEESYGMSTTNWHVVVYDITHFLRRIIFSAKQFHIIYTR
jgi:hypothetical protein